MKMNHHYGELKASYLFVDIAHKVAAYQEAHPEKEIMTPMRFWGSYAT